MYVCVCHAVNCHRVRQALAEGKQTVGELRAHFGFDSCCGKCTRCMRSLIDQHRQSTTAAAAGDPICKAITESLNC